MPADNTKLLNQYFTPVWAAERIYETFFSDIEEGAYVIEPSCGDGRFLQAIPEGVHAVGVEIDPVMAERARQRTGRQVITGDFRKVEIEGKADLIAGNPPFELSIVDGMLERAKELLKPHGRCGFILPAYTFQTPSRVVRYAMDWCLEPHFLPRTLFPGIKMPLMFAMFRQEGQQWVGMTLYPETRDIENMKKEYSATLKNGTGSVWKAALEQALHALGGEAKLSDIYEEISTKRPTETNWWKEKIRQMARRHFQQTGPGRYALPQAVAA
ncbi:class I SAM-dependent methyltransferase [Sulfitobacter sp. R18_1]|uniref:methyltransferase domain-containing protein n=1 Tax=Sulfitobacter sp. R18_1 TaxID=2821104 RepID=UPI001ADA4571|nr:class I SAM-dependent methyltransferase [Sulfitobacter sp. R18_1]MBO9428347.1 class I SAM-dependent methyltransferase [Sulfitobacter sp. R18_1]